MANSIKGLAIGSFVILVIYSLLPEMYRFSRAIILISSLLSIVTLILIRSLFSILLPSIFNENDIKKKTIIVGEQKDVDRVKRIMDINGVNYEFVGGIYPDEDESKEYDNDFIGVMSGLEQIVDRIGVDEVVFCLGKVEMSRVVDSMHDIGHKVKVKIIPDEESAIIGSSGRNSRGEFYNLDMNFNLDKKGVRTIKYTVDFIISILFLLLSPFMLFNKKVKIKSILDVLMLKKTWISYIHNDNRVGELPKLKNGVYSPSFKDNISGISNKDLHNMNLIYARNYTVSLDLEYLFKHLFKR